MRTANIHIPSRHLKIFLYYMIKSRCTNQGIHFTPSLLLQLINYGTLNQHVKHLLAYAGKAYHCTPSLTGSLSEQKQKNKTKKKTNDSENNCVLTAKGTNEIKMD